MKQYDDVILEIKEEEEETDEEDLDEDPQVEALLDE